MKSTKHEACHDSNTSPDGYQSDTSPDGHQSEQGTGSVSKRALLKVGWVAPVIVALSLPRSGYAANISGGHSAPKNGDHEPKSNHGNHFGQLKKSG